MNPLRADSKTPPPAAEKGDKAPDLTGQVLGDFCVLRRLGEGGMGQVYVAEQISLKRKVALKVLRNDLAANSTALARFKAEAEAVARATHANIVQVYAIGEINGLNYMALEYVEGRNLRQYLEKKGTPEVPLALSIMRQVASALQRASELGIIHRDIKPENILITRKGEVKVTDFGLSRIFADDRQPVNLTQSGVTMGTPLYMSPEQVEGKPIDPRTDIYSFGVTCYHLLAGEPPFRGATAFEVAVQHVQQHPTPLQEIRPDLPPELCDLIHRMMAKDPEQRIQTGSEIIREVARVRAVLATATTGAAPALRTGVVAPRGDSGIQKTHIVQMGPGGSTAFDATLTQTMPPRRSSTRWPWLAALMVLAALGAGLGYGWWRSQDQRAGNGEQSPPALQPEPGPPEPAGKVAATPTEEQRLLDSIKKHELLDPIQATRDRVNLAVYYVKNWRFQEAKKEFKFFEDANEKAKGTFYLRTIGLLGKAVLLALEDQTKDSIKQSNQLFLSLLEPAKGKQVLGPTVLHNQPGLAEQVAKALEYNYANDPARFPAALHAYRNPPVAKVKSSS
jgi:serine/threonine-protein kinase